MELEAAKTVFVADLVIVRGFVWALCCACLLDIGTKDDCNKSD